MHSLRGLLVGGLASLVLGGLALSARAECRIAFDMGSSGLRAGASETPGTARRDIDYLAPQWAGRGLDELESATVAALRELPVEAGLGDCPKVGGGFSAWRMAAERNAPALAALLGRLREASGVAVLVIPQQREGAYGVEAARAALGERLTTSHVLDIGGGSLQVAGAQASFGDLLGQKVWHRLLCHEIRNSETSPCPLQPMTSDELAVARTLLREKLADVGNVLPLPVSMTAISRPVSRGVLPAVKRLAGDTAEVPPIRRAALAQAIAQLAGMTREETAKAVGSPVGYVAYLLSDMLLVEGLLDVTGAEALQVAEADLTNLPGLLHDEQAFAWGRRYDCYLARLPELGVEAFNSDPATCPE